jgi:WD40 repeat protein
MALTAYLTALLLHGAGRLALGARRRLLHWKALFLVSLGLAALAGALLVQPPRTARGAILGQHDYWIRSLAFSPDGARLAAAGGILEFKNELRIWDVSTGRHQIWLRGDGPAIETIAFSPDGRWLALALRRQSVKLLDAATGKEQAHFAGRLYFSFDPDGRELIVLSPDGSASARDLASGSLRRLPAPGPGQNFICACLPQGLLLTHPDRSTLGVWNLATQQERARFAFPTAIMSSGGALSRDGQLLAVGGWHGDIFFFNLRTQRTWSSRHKLGEPINSLAFSPDGQTLVSGGQDHSVRLWDVSSGEELGILGEHEAAVFAVSFAPDGRRIASGGFDKVIRLWDTEQLR